MEFHLFNDKNKELNTSFDHLFTIEKKSFFF